LRHLNWTAMLDSLEKNAAYSFLNRMYKRSEKSHAGLSRCSRNGEENVYLSYLDERRCIFKHGERSKLIVSTRHSVHIAVHKMCQFSGKKRLFLVDKDVAISAHYRKSYLRQCYNYFSTNKSHHLSSLLNKYVNKSCT